MTYSQPVHSKSNAVAEPGHLLQGLLMLDWLQNNKTWVFSGVGVAVVMAIAAAIRLLIRRKSPTRKPAEAELQIHVEESQPQFSWTHRATDPSGAITRRFRNQGGRVSHVVAQTTAPVKVEWHPKDSLAANGEGWVRFTPRGNGVPLPLTWEIHYRTALGQAESNMFRLTTVGEQPERLESPSAEA